jgi:hypothetical protein
MISMLKLLAEKPYSEIDEKIKCLVDVMNGSGAITTVASCQGHFYPFYRPPYVYFRTSLNTAAAIQKALNQAWTNDQLNNYWTLDAAFNMNYEICFALNAPRYEEVARSMINSLISFYLFRKKVDADISTLAELIQTSMPKWSEHENLV